MEGLSSNFYHYTCQLDDKVFQLENYALNFRSIVREPDCDSYIVHSRASLNQKRYGPSMIPVYLRIASRSQHLQEGPAPIIFVSGGASDGEELKSCEYYTESTDRWRIAPQELNEGRYQHASCTVNDRYIYVFCGYNRQR